MLLTGLALGGAVLAGLHFALYDTYWDYSEGVYAYSSYLMLKGGALYTGFVGAQPPGVFLAGFALLAIHSTLEWLRFAVGCLQLGAGLIGAAIVMRLTGSRLAGAVTPAAMLLTPWAVHEHGALTPELVALPLIMGAALLSIHDRQSALAGVLCGLLPVVKVPFLIPAVALVVLSADVRRTARWAIATLILGFGVTSLAAGASFWRDVFIAQIHIGTVSLGVLKGFWAQEAWNIAGLIICAATAVVYRARTRDPRMLRTMIGLAGAMIVTFLTNFKLGTGLNISVPVEAALVPLAASGTVFAFRNGRPRWVPAVCVIALAFTLAQSVSLITDPRHSEPFLRAGSKPAWAVVMTGWRLRQNVEQARGCRAGVPYSGPPLIALIARRRMPAGQPDQFITFYSSTFKSIHQRMVSVRPLCP